MDNLSNFKTFVKDNGHLASHVNSGSVTWQNMYEMYDMYGENHSVWDKYKVKETKTVSKNNSFSDIINMVKKLDADKVQSGIGSMQKLLALVGGLFGGETSATGGSSYKPRPIYQRFED